MTQASAVLADLLRAFALLEPEDDTVRAAIAAMLGVEPVEIPVEPAKPEPPLPRPPEDPKALDPRAREQQRPPESRRQDDAPLRLPQDEAREPAERSAVLKPDFTGARRPPGWLERVEPLAESGTEAPPAVPVPDSLFDPRWTRALLSSSLATFSGAGPLDIARLVRGVTRGTPWRSVPRRPWPTLARGVQVLVDRGEAMLPFAADQDGLLDKLRQIVGPGLLEVLRFDGSPGRKVGAGSRRTWKPYFEHHRPRPGVAVLALTDLGIGASGPGARPARPEEWRAFAEGLHRSGCPLLAFVPYGRERWPPELLRVLKILSWDRATSVRTVRRAIGRALAAPKGPR